MLDCVLRILSYNGRVVAFMSQENRPELPLLPSGIDEPRPNLPVAEVAIETGHHRHDLSCVCGSPTRLAYQPEEIWGKRLIVVASRQPVYQCTDEECGFVLLDNHACLEFYKKALVLVRPTRDRDTITYLSQSVRAARRHIKAFER